MIQVQEINKYYYSLVIKVLILLLLFLKVIINIKPIELILVKHHK